MISTLSSRIGSVLNTEICSSQTDGSPFGLGEMGGRLGIQKALGVLKLSESLNISYLAT